MCKSEAPDTKVTSEEDHCILHFAVVLSDDSCQTPSASFAGYDKLFGCPVHKASKQVSSKLSSFHEHRFH